ncbi:MAG: hypothetical protein LC740_15370 [Actinobacteria bacterium]|nr:hypothetical protein [Actinomycetota bacterium]
MSAAPSRPLFEMSPGDEHVGGDYPEDVSETQHGAVVSYGYDYLRGRGWETRREAAYEVELVQLSFLPNQLRGSRRRR